MPTLCENHPSAPPESPLQLIAGSAPSWAFRIVDPTTCLVPTGGISGYEFGLVVYDADGDAVVSFANGGGIYITSAANGVVQLDWSPALVALLSTSERYTYKLTCTVGVQTYVAARGSLDVLP